MNHRIKNSFAKKNPHENNESLVGTGSSPFIPIL
jgi:hypothetical protein